MGKMNLRIISKKNCGAKDQPISISVPLCSLSVLLEMGITASWKGKKVTIPHLAIFIYCISLYLLVL